MISLGSFTLIDPSNVVSVSVTSSIDIQLPESLAKVCDTVDLAAKVKLGDLWFDHSGSCLLQVAFQVNGTPIKSDYTYPRWGRTLADCEVRCGDMW